MRLQLNKVTHDRSRRRARHVGQPAARKRAESIDSKISSNKKESVLNRIVDSVFGRRSCQNHEEEEEKRKELWRPRRLSQMPGETLARSLEGIVNQPNYSDVCFCVGGGGREGLAGDKKAEKPTKMYALKSILACRSNAFRNMLYGPEGEEIGKKQADDDSEYEFLIPDVTPDAFLIVLEFIYTDQVSSLSPSSSFAVMFAARKFELPKLHEECVEYIKQHLSIENVLNLWDQSDAILDDDEKQQVEVAYLAFIHENGEAILGDPKFVDLSKGKVIKIIESSELKVSSEYQIFRACLAWCNAECLRCKLAAGIDTIAEKMREIIPHIRFPLMTAEEFLGPVQKSRLIPVNHILPICTYIVTKDPESEKNVRNLGYMMEIRKGTDVSDQQMTRSASESNSIGRKSDLASSSSSPSFGNLDVSFEKLSKLCETCGWYSGVDHEGTCKRCGADV